MRKIKLIFNICMLALTACLLIGVAYSWYVYNKTVFVTGGTGSTASDLDGDIVFSIIGGDVNDNEALHPGEVKIITYKSTEGFSADLTLSFNVNKTENILENAIDKTIFINHGEYLLENSMIYPSETLDIYEAAYYSDCSNVSNAIRIYHSFEEITAEDALEYFESEDGNYLSSYDSKSDTLINNEYNFEARNETEIFIALYFDPNMITIFNHEELGEIQIRSSNPYYMQKLDLIIKVMEV